MVSQQSADIVFAAICCWREARGELESVRIGVLSVMANRVKAHWISDQTFQDVAGHPWQFSGLTAPGDPNLIKWPHSTEGAWLDILKLAEGVVTGMLADPTFGATFYHDVSLPGPPANWGPVSETIRMGRVVFYRGV